MPKRIQSSGRNIVLSVRDFCEREKDNNAPLIPFSNVRQRVAAMTGISEKTVSTITKEGESTSQKITTPRKKRMQEKKIILDDFDLCAVRNKIHEMPVVFLDETYIHASYTVNKCWQIENEGVLKHIYRIIVHAGGEMGFIPNVLLIFKSKSKSGDYHDDMNKTNFMKWLQEKLIPNLPANSLVVMDNAPYHTVKLNKAPTLSSTKAEMQNWIINKGLSYLPTMVKAQLYEIIKEHKEAPIYEADQMLQAHGHKVARLPPYHCELNAIEFMWSLVKRRVASKNVGQETNNIVNLTEEAFQTITAEDWQKQCEHVRHIEDKLCERDRCVDAEIDRFIIELNFSLS
ncbi:unnamed protein product [Euphydryas editha]|uniref:Tc1-like transposase DDE domain-containing protein n=1 Tax=Euphydryas editha TaxID=104508 RepID=A0AAU9TRC0_EUPED|nr:unnamed protein product [Euphydryas editha]